MGRYIDADAEIERLIPLMADMKDELNMLESEQEKAESADYSEAIEQCKKNLQNYRTKIKILNNAPTAYDIDKVVEQLKCAKEDYWEGISYRNMAINDAIEIVKAGSVE